MMANGITGDVSTVMRNAQDVQGRSLWGDARRRLLRNRAAVLSMAVLAVIALMAVFAPLLSQYAYDAQDYTLISCAPNWWHSAACDAGGTHWFGTDNLGRDVASQILAGSRVSILVGVIAVGIGLGFGIVLGLVAAFSKGLVEDGLMKLSDFVFAFPALLLAIMLTSTFGPGVVNAIIAIGVYNVPIIAKLTRATANGVLSREYALAARAAGRGPIAIAVDHVLPNIAPALIVQATIQFAIAILAEAALSYLGLGAQPPETSWGKMLADAQNVLYNAPRLALYPGIAIALSVLGLNLLGDGLRDALDPKLKARG
jgi:peptide/nickel transport system permease protein